MALALPVRRCKPASFARWMASTGRVSGFTFEDRESILVPARAEPVPPNRRHALNRKKAIGRTMARLRKPIAWIPGAKQALQHRGYGKCSLCRRDWRDAKPFVEGPAEFLICWQCVADLRARGGESSGDSDATQSHVDAIPPLTSAEAVNPYASPKAMETIKKCSLCGQFLGPNFVSADSGKAAFCATCISEASALIESALARRK